MAEPTLLYTAGPQLWKVRAVMWLMLGMGLGFLWWGFDLAQTYGLNPGDGGVLRPPAERLAWGLGVGLLGLLPVAGMVLYGWLYVARIDYTAGADRLAVTTLRYWGSAVHLVPVALLVRRPSPSGRVLGGQVFEQQAVDEDPTAAGTL